MLNQLIGAASARLLRTAVVVAGMVAVLSSRTASAAEAELEIVPASVDLTGPGSSSRVFVERLSETQRVGQISSGVKWSTDDSKIATVSDGEVTAVGNGTTTLRAMVDGRKLMARVTVKNAETELAPSFRNHVLAVFAKTGCNSGACHGALAGKGGFRLSLRGYDPATDYQTIVTQARGRRIELADPGRSLILAKPTGALPHKGGLRFETDSREYKVIADWIAGGAVPPADTDPSVERVEILPEAVQLAVGDEQDFIVRAHYSNGRVEDVTRWVKFSSSNESVASVDNDGRVSVTGPGAGAVTAWFASRTVISRITCAFPNDIPEDVYESQPRRNFIDDHVVAKLSELRLEPSPQCSDVTFVRRAFLDVIGTLPTPTEVREFLADETDGKRDRLIESLLARPEFVDYWAYKWSDVLLVNGNKLRPQGVKAYYEWIRNEISENTPWDEFARKIVTSTGGSIENGATNFFALHQDPENMAENVSQAFLGLSIACAKCHNHPLEKWTNSQYYAFANLFSRVRAKGWGGDFRNGDGVRTLYVVPTGELIQPLTGKPQPPTPLDGEPLPFDATDDRRIHLANWLTAPENPYFARAITNRVWANFFGPGLVEEVDDLRLSNPASNEELLVAASQHLIDRGFDLKSLMRTILQSHTYQRSGVPLDGNRDEHRFYSRYYPKRLMAEVLLDAVSQVTDVPTAFTHIGFPGGDRQETKEYPLGTRAIQLHDSAVESYFLKTFGRNSRAITCECERSDEPSMVQVLHVANGDTINGKLKEKENRVSQLLAAGHSDADLTDEIFLHTLSRFPIVEEKTRVVELLSQVPGEDAAEKRLVVEDIFWSLLSTREFLFNH
ncbi:MAG: DUF1549 domain-containing protein [Planctomycetota bacterium]|nr:DUF1549 domain-containing protein [Planctomycetota bacterium]